MPISCYASVWPERRFGQKSAPCGVENRPLECRLRAKVQKQANRYPRSLQVVAYLREVPRFDVLRRFDFDDDQLVDQNVDAESGNLAAAEVHRHGCLARNSEAGLRQRERESGTVDEFGEPASELVVSGVEDANYLVRQVTVQKLERAVGHVDCCRKGRAT